MNPEIKNNPVIIALCGKGGVGKTSLSALITRIFIKNPNRRVLAIDADPAVGLSYPLGITITKTVDQIRRDLIQKLGTSETLNRQDIISQLDYDLFSALAEQDNLAFLAIGRPEGDGCYCRVNALLRDLIQTMAGQFDVVVIDGEAGLEQINRRVMDMVTHLVIVSDASLKGRRVAETIHRLGQANRGYEHSGVLYNRLTSVMEEKTVMTHNTLPLIHLMFENNLLKEFDREGRSFFDLPWSENLELFEDAVRRFTGVYS